MGEAVTDIWMRYPYDEALYLKRCEDPFEAEGVVSAHATDRPYVASINAFEGHDLRTFGVAAMRCIRRGITVSDLQRELEVLEDTMKELISDAEA